MVRTSATTKTDLSAIMEDLKPLEDAVKNLGAPDKRWNYIYGVIAVLTALMIGTVYIYQTTEGVLFINASTEINGSLNVRDNVSAANFYGDGSGLTGVGGGNTTAEIFNVVDNNTFVKFTNTSWIAANQNYNTTADMFNAVNNGTFIKEESDPIFLAWDKDYTDLINKPTKFGNTSSEIFAVVNNNTFIKVGSKVGNTTIEIFNAVNNNTFLKTESDPIYSAWDKDYTDLINKPTKFGNTTIEIFNAVNNNTFLKSYTESDPKWTSNSSTVARIGTCTAGNVVQNTTITGVQCVADKDTTYANSSFDLSKLANTGTVNIGGYNFSVDTKTLFVDASLNRVGIGTDTPAFAATINHTNAPILQFRWEDNNSYGGFVFYEGATPMAEIIMHSTAFDMLGDTTWQNTTIFSNLVNNNGKFFFRTKTGGTVTEKVTITNSGSVGIGDNTPDAKLDVVGNITQDDNYYHCFGDACDAHIRFNGTSLIIKVN